ncbi:hypothetical protein JYU20_02535 [Bacteroidales bacterium AH-315-I05]|nr:hypothetical protein [Bacteroidales bacterium AH-315-I05]
MNFGEKILSITKGENHPQLYAANNHLTPEGEHLLAVIMFDYIHETALVKN